MNPLPPLRWGIPVYYGWAIVGIALASMGFWFGIRGVFSVFYAVLLEEFQWGRAQAAGVQSVALLVYTILAPLVGGLIDRFGPRRVIVPGILFFALGLILCAFMQTLTQFFVFYGLIAAAGVTCVGIVSYSAILAHWFEEKRGTANGIAVSGMGLGTFVLVLLTQHVISVWGWRLAFLVLGGLSLCVLLPLNGLFLRHKPQDLGLVADGRGGNGIPRKRGWQVMDAAWDETDWTLEKAMGVGRFWALMTFPFLVVIAIYIVLVHHVRFLIDIGIDKMTAAYVLAAIGIIGAIFRIFWGWLSDRIGREKTYTLGAISICLGVGSLIAMDVSSSRTLLPFFVFFFGAGWAVTAPTFMSVSADLFRGRAFGLIYGILEGVIGAGCALGALIAGIIFDQTQSYQWAFVLALLVTMVSAVFVWLAAPRKVRYVGTIETTRLNPS